MSGSPTRTCVGCGRKAPQGVLVRYVARDGVLTVSPRGGGRSAYTCPRQACFERAVARRAFARTLRQSGLRISGQPSFYTERDG